MIKNMDKPIKKIIWLSIICFIIVVVEKLYMAKVHNTIIDMNYIVVLISVLAINCIIYILSKRKFLDNIIKKIIYASFGMSLLMLIAKVVLSLTNKFEFNNIWLYVSYWFEIVSVLILFYSLNNSAKSLLIIPIMLVSTVAKLPLVFIIGFICWVICLIKEKNIGYYKKPIFVMGLITVILMFIQYCIEYKYIVMQTNNIFNLISNNNIDYLAVLTVSIKFILLYCIISVCTKYINTYIPKEYICFIGYLKLAMILSIILVNYKLSYLIIIVALQIIALCVLLKRKSNILSKNEKISIIVPIYNVASYLERALNSIINQTYKNIEIILVNDGSPDNSEEICLEYLNKDDRIRYIKQENAGLSAARNTGMRESTGDYFIFIDSDDYINANFVEELYATLLQTDSDIAVCDFRVVCDEPADISKKENGLIQEYSKTKKYCNLYNRKSLATIVAWNKIYKKQLFDNIKYPVGKVHEDEYVIHYLLENAQKIAYTTCKYYYYYQRAGSITGNYNKKRLDVLNALKDRLNFFNEKGCKKLYSLCLINYYLQLENHLHMMLQYCSNENQMINDITKERDEYKKIVLLNKNVSILFKTKIVLKDIMKGSLRR